MFGISFNFDSLVNMPFVDLRDQNVDVCFILCEHQCGFAVTKSIYAIVVFSLKWIFFLASEITLMGLIFHWIHRFESRIDFLLHHLNPSPSDINSIHRMLEQITL